MPSFATKGHAPLGGGEEKFKIIWKVGGKTSSFSKLYDKAEKIAVISNWKMPITFSSTSTQRPFYSFELITISSPIDPISHKALELALLLPISDFYFLPTSVFLTSSPTFFFRAYFLEKCSTLPQLDDIPFSLSSSPCHPFQFCWFSRDCSFSF